MSRGERIPSPLPRHIRKRGKQKKQAPVRPTEIVMVFHANLTVRGYEGDLVPIQTVTVPADTPVPERHRSWKKTGSALKCMLIQNLPFVNTTKTLSVFFSVFHKNMLLFPPFFAYP